MVSGEGDAGSDGGTEEAEREREYVGCKPLAPAEATRIAEAAEAGTASRIGRIFYGSEPLYIFFRLHQLLYDRCAHSLPAPAHISRLKNLKSQYDFYQLGQLWRSRCMRNSSQALHGRNTPSL